jgi:hypothetical protein
VVKIIGFIVSLEKETKERKCPVVCQQERHLQFLLTTEHALSQLALYICY